MPVSGDARPFPKSAQLARGERRYRRKVAGAKRWQQIASAKTGACRCCGRSTDVQLHHLVPRSQGGSDTEANIVPLCRLDHGRVEAHDPLACAKLRRSLTDAEYAYAVETLGESRFEQRYPVKYQSPGGSA